MGRMWISKQPFARPFWLGEILGEICPIRMPKWVGGRPAGCGNYPRDDWLSDENRLGLGPIKSPLLYQLSYPVLRGPITTLQEIIRKALPAPAHPRRITPTTRSRSVERRWGFGSGRMRNPAGAVSMALSVRGDCLRC
jgi:hypothetical protein